MRQTCRALASLFVIAFATLPALAQQKPGGPSTKSGTRYDVEFVFNSTTYAGTMTLTIAKGAVTGSMAIETPTKVTGEVAGTLKGTKLLLDYPFVMAGEQQCTGRVAIEATRDPKTNAARGSAHTTGCGDPGDGTFAITPAAKK